jgi:protein-S-isoprenylcysteine O-methyltransferase Ste14
VETEGQARRAWWSPAVWLVYVLIVFEILFMISPFALYYYSAYRPFLNLLRRSPATAWLDQFFLPHFSQTSSPLLEALGRGGEPVFFAGVLLFLIGFVQIYGTKLFRRGRAVTGGLYRWIRHPQYLAVGVMGIGVLLHWPRFLVLVGFVTMLYLYYFLARHEEHRCLARYGESYRLYLESTGMFFPHGWFAWMPSLLPAGSPARALALLGIYVALVGAAVLAGFALQSFSLRQVSAHSADDLVILSPARLEERRLTEATRLAAADSAVAARLSEQGYGRGEKFLVYVVPMDWRLPDLPMEAQPTGGHFTPPDFNPDALKVLFTRVELFDREAAGLDIVKRAVRRVPVVLVKVDLAAGLVLGTEIPPPTVRWGDVPTPYF